MVEYTYTHCGVVWDHSVDDLMMQPCPRCGSRVGPCRVDGIPFLPKSFQPHFDRASGVVVKSAKEKRRLHDELGLVEMPHREFVTKIHDPVLHEQWKKDNGDPTAFETPVKMPSVDDVKDGLERVRSRLKVDPEYRRRFDPNEPGFRRESPEGGPPS